MSPAGLPTTVDVLVVGAGTAGSVVATRAAEAGLDVLLLEAGAHEPDERAGLLDIGPDSQVVTHVAAMLGGAAVELPRGRTVGGSGAVNGGYCVAPRPSDLAEWAGAGPCEGGAGGEWTEPMAWGLARAAERLRPHTAAPGPLARRIGRAFPGTGVSVGQARRGALRVSAFRAWEPAAAGARVRTGVEVAHLDWRGGRVGGDCSGVVLADGSVVSARETVLAAGGVGSAALLLVSGIGPATGHPVGERAQEHPERLVDLEVPAGSTELPSPPGPGDPLPPLLARVHGLRLGGGREAPEIELRPYAVPFDHVIPGVAPQPPRLGLALMNPRGRAEVTTDVTGRPHVILDAHPDPADAAALDTAEALVRERLARVGLVTGASRVSTSQHLASTAPIGTALDHRGRVLGVTGLRVVDAAALPSLPRCGPYLTVLSLAEVLADGLVDDLRPVAWQDSGRTAPP